MPVRRRHGLVSDVARVRSGALSRLWAPDPRVNGDGQQTLTHLDLDLLHSTPVTSMRGGAIGLVSGVYVDHDDQPVVLAVGAGRLSVREVLVPASGAVLVGRTLVAPVSDAALAGAPLSTDPFSDDADLVSTVLAYWQTCALPLIA